MTVSLQALEHVRIVELRGGPDGSYNHNRALKLITQNTFVENSFCGVNGECLNLSVKILKYYLMLTW